MAKRHLKLSAVSPCTESWATEGSLPLETEKWPLKPRNGYRTYHIKSGLHFEPTNCTSEIPVRKSQGAWLSHNRRSLGNSAKQENNRKFSAVDPPHCQRFTLTHAGTSITTAKQATSFSQLNKSGRHSVAFRALVNSRGSRYNLYRFCRGPSHCPLIRHFRGS